jgi:hypothetical protein
MPEKKRYLVEVSVVFKTTVFVDAASRLEAEMEAEEAFVEIDEDDDTVTIWSEGVTDDPAYAAFDDRKVLVTSAVVAGPHEVH